MIYADCAPTFIESAVGTGNRRRENLARLMLLAIATEFKGRQRVRTCRARHTYRRRRTVVRFRMPFVAAGYDARFYAQISRGVVIAVP
jgi:hypothetical protein